MANTTNLSDYRSISDDAPLILQNFPEGLGSYSNRPCVKCLSPDGAIFFMRLSDYRKIYKRG